jgi:hypothetical protein
MVGEAAAATRARGAHGVERPRKQTSGPTGTLLQPGNIGTTAKTMLLIET